MNFDLHQSHLGLTQCKAKEPVQVKKEKKRLKKNKKAAWREPKHRCLLCLDL